LVAGVNLFFLTRRTISTLFPPMPKAVVLFSGGLDSLLTLFTLQKLGVEVTALNIMTPLHDVSEAACERAAKYGFPILLRQVGEHYADLILHPKWGYGSNINPCLDCRVEMLRIAKQVMKEIRANFIATGEIAGQRPNSQKMHQLALIAREADVVDILVRPLSAKALYPTKVERDGLLDREQLHGFTGRGRVPLLQIAKEFGIEDIPQPASGCFLCEKTFAPRVLDLIRHMPRPTCWDFETLRYGRAIRIDENVRIIVARQSENCHRLVTMFERADRQPCALLEPENFHGPALLLVGNFDETHLQLAGSLLLRFTNATRFDPSNAFARVRTFQQNYLTDEIRQIAPSEKAVTFRCY